MIFADKLIQLRKKAGWSQEELAGQMNVSRQSVSKWEGAQSIPDLEKMIRLSKLFGVTTDYLLKDEIEEIGNPETVITDEEETSRKHVSMEEANSFLSVKEETSKTIAFGTFLCILSPICFFILGAISEDTGMNISEDAAGGIGMILMLILIAVAVAIFIYSGSKTAPFEYLEKEVFETEYGVTGMVKERRDSFKDAYVRNNIIGVSLCVMALIPLFGGAAINGENDLFMVFMFCVSIVIVGIGVVFLIRAGIIWASFEKLLQEGDYTRAKKKQTLKSLIALVYWLVATAIYLACTLPSESWKEGWIVWVIAAVLFPAVIAIANAIENNRRK